MPHKDKDRMASKMRRATAAAKRQGFTSFKEGSPGARRREKIAKKIEEAAHRRGKK